MALRPRLGEGFSGHSGVLSAAKRMPTVLQTADPNPSEYPPTCCFSIARRVNTAFCPCGVRSPGVCLVSATQVLDHVPSSPAESSSIPLSHRRPGPGRRAAKPPACRSQCPPLPPVVHAPDSVPPWKSDLHGHRSHPRQRFPGEPGTGTAGLVRAVLPRSRHCPLAAHLAAAAGSLAAAAFDVGEAHILA
jgi:hypothetical protein